MLYLLGTLPLHLKGTLHTLKTLEHAEAAFCSQLLLNNVTLYSQEMILAKLLPVYYVYFL